MKKKKWRRGPLALLFFGALLALVSLAMLESVDDVLQYAVTAPATKDEVLRLVEAKRETGESLMDCTSATAIGGVKEKDSVSANGKSGSAAVYAVGEGWFEIYPVFLADGRRITETEFRRGDKVALLDADLAFSLFGAELPEDAKATIGGSEYAVVGTVRHSRSVGEVAEHNAYVPLLADPEAALDTLMVSAKPIPNSGARTMFESTMRTSWKDGGCFYSLEKECMRRTMLLRLMFLVFGAAGLLALLRRMNGVAAGRADAFRQALCRNYFPQTVPQLLVLVVVCLVGYGALLAALWALMTYSVQPLYVFTEWVPENIVEWSSLKDVFWSLTGSAAKLVKVGSREMRRIEFWGAMLRWGTICALWGAVMERRRGR